MLYFGSRVLSCISGSILVSVSWVLFSSFWAFSQKSRLCVYVSLFMMFAFFTFSRCAFLCAII